MTEVEPQSEIGSDNIKPKVSNWAKRSFYYGVFACVFVILFLLTQTYGWGKNLESNWGLTLVAVSFISFPVLSIIAAVCGVVGLINIKRKRNTLKGTDKAVEGLLLSLPGILVMLWMCIFLAGELSITRNIIRPMLKCRDNLNALQKAIKVYSKDNGGKYPAADKWCDMLVAYAGVTKEQFKCPSDKTGPCSYAINPNAEPNSPPDMVLLFETKGRWNQFGGPELMTFENHNGEGCNVLFNDGHVEFITPGEKDKLMWKDRDNSVTEK